MKCIRYIFYIYFLFAPTFLYAQNPKKYYKTAEDFIESKRYNDAIDLLTKAIDLEPDFEEAYLLRAFSYERIGNYRNAVEDYKRASVFLYKETDVFYKAGRCYFKLRQYNDALEMLNKALDLKKSNLEALQLKVLTLIELEEYFNALQAAEDAVKEKSTAENYYYQGLVSEKLKNMTGAQNDYERALKKDKDYVPAYIALAELALKNGEITAAVGNIEEALSRDPKNINAILVRSEIAKAKHDYSNAISDLSEAILIDSENPELFQLRGNLYSELKQYQNAIYDFSQVIDLDNRNIDAYYQRAEAYEIIRNKEAALEDYKMLVEFTEDDLTNKDIFLESENRIFELNRENNNPELVIQEPVFNNKAIDIPKNTNGIRIRGRVSDESEISFLKINDNDVVIIEDINGLGFDYDLYLGDENSISIIVGDVYNNILHESFQINRTEVIPPKINLIAPYASDTKDIFLSDTSSNIYVEGQIEDESMIASIVIEGITASYRLEEINPTFSTSINITNKNKFKISATDEFGNEAVEVYRLIREANNSLTNNPMGKTWVVFIENSNYQNFPVYEQASEDINRIKDVLSNYSIHNIIHKKDLGKHELERFFAIELRDLIRSNKVNSILLFYAGKSVNDNGQGYWLPYDARQGENFSYFNINALKASLQGYTKYLTHMLVITDVCGQESKFYTADDNIAEPFPNCDDAEFVKQKSFQVFGIANSERLEGENSFTQAFVDVLKTNPKRCLSVNELYADVSELLKIENDQSPVLGNILELDDKEGAFFFVQKSSKVSISEVK